MTQGGQIRFYEIEGDSGVKICVCVSTWHGNLRGQKFVKGGECPLLPLNEALNIGPCYFTVAPILS